MLKGKSEKQTRDFIEVMPPDKTYNRFIMGRGICPVVVFSGNGAAG
jgi:hypothetical protein